MAARRRPAPAASAAVVDPPAAAVVPSAGPGRGEGDAERQVVVLHLGEEQYGVEIGRVHEIIRPQPITRVPRAPSFVEGVINLRGRVIPVLDLRRRFGMPAHPHTQATRIVVTELSDQVVGIMVDGVTEVLRVPDAAIEPPTAVVAGLDAEYLQGIAKLEDGLVILLDVDRVLGKEERRVLESA